MIVTVQPAELLRHLAIENHFAMGRMPAGTMVSYCNHYKSCTGYKVHKIMKGCDIMDYAILSNQKGFTVFRYMDYVIRFKAPYSLERYTEVKE